MSTSVRPLPALPALSCVQSPPTRLRRREDYLYGDTYGHVSKGEGPVSVMGQDSDLGTAEAGPSGDADVTDPNSS